MWGSFAVYGVKLHLVCSTNRVPVFYELTAVEDVLLVRELLKGAGLDDEGGMARSSPGDLASRGEDLREDLTGSGVVLPRRGPTSKTLAGLWIRVVAKLAAYTYHLYVDRLLGRPQGRIKELWA